ncbi:hypothetical protein JW823_02755 [bacterium]|nr:hypothetical protein [candidate division CSSED10-310 bacterium]
MKKVYASAAWVCIVCCVAAIQAGAGGLSTGMRTGSRNTALPGGVQDLLQLTIKEGKTLVSGEDYTWTESLVEPYSTSSQGYVDAITGQDGYLYCGFYDDRTIAGNPNHKSVFIRKSTDGGATWGNIDGGATGFALAYLGAAGGERGPSIEVFETTPGNYRIAVAVYAGNQTLTYFSAIVLWKNLGSNDDWMAVYVSNQDYDFALPRLTTLPRPGQPSRNRVIVSYISMDYGYYISKYSDTDATSFITGVFISDIDAAEFWKPDFMYDSVNNRLFCVWSMSELNDPQQLPKVLIAMSPNSGLSWNLDIFQISPTSWNTCAEASCALTENPLTSDRTLMVVYSAQQNPSDIFRVEYTYQFLEDIMASGSDWHIAPEGHPVIRGTIYSDTDADNTMASIVSDNRFDGGGYRVVLLDETSVSGSRMLFKETGFDAPFIWESPEVVSAPGADPARQGPNTGVSSGVAVGTGVFDNRRFAFWPDYRSGTLCDVYCARADGEPPVPTPTPTATDIPTMTPTSLPTATPTDTPPPIPSTSPGSAGILLIMIGLIMGIQGWKRG